MNDEIVPYKCEICGCEDCDATYQENPYIAEIYGDIQMQWLCSSCYHELCMDI